MAYFDIIRETDVSGIQFLLSPKPGELALSLGSGPFIVDNIVVLVQMHLSVKLKRASPENLVSSLLLNKGR